MDFGQPIPIQIATPSKRFSPWLFAIPFVIVVIVIVFVVIYVLVLDKKMCDSNTDCNLSPGTRYCNPSSHTCVECIADSDCATSTLTSGSHSSDKCLNNVCVCGESDKCKSPTPVCDTTSKCVQCLVDADCPSTSPYCDVASKTCYTCNTATGVYTNTCKPGFYCTSGVSGNGINGTCTVGQTCTSPEECSPGGTCFGQTCDGNSSYTFIPNVAYPSSENEMFLDSTTSDSLGLCASACQDASTACSRVSWDYNTKKCSLFTGTTANDSEPTNANWSATNLANIQSCNIFNDTKTQSRQIPCGVYNYKDDDDTSETFHVFPGTEVLSQNPTDSSTTTSLRECYSFCKKKLGTGDNHEITCSGENYLLGTFDDKGLCSCYNLPTTITNMQQSISAKTTTISSCYQ